LRILKLRAYSRIFILLNTKQNGNCLAYTEMKDFKAQD